jgi:tyrosyl-tRNA synthetase
MADLGIGRTRDELDDILNRKRIGAYVGIDPTASSMHVGHLIPFMALFWMYIHGYHAVTLVPLSLSLSLFVFQPRF